MITGWIFIHTVVINVCLKDNGKARKNMTKDGEGRYLRWVFLVTEWYYQDKRELYKLPITVLAQTLQPLDSTFT